MPLDYISLLEVRQTEKDMAVVTHVGRNYGCGWTKRSQIILGNLGLSALFRFVQMDLTLLLVGMNLGAILRKKGKKKYIVCRYHSIIQTT